jgi:hypothetical protein
MHLITRDVARLALEAYDKKQLSAQNGSPVCKYRDDGGFACAVGVALTDEQAWELDARAASGVPSLLRSGWITTDNEAGLASLQMAHDDWLVSGVDRDGRFINLARELAQ